MLLQNLHHRYLYIIIKLPHLSDLEQQIPDFLNYDNYASLHASNPDPLLDDTPTANCFLPVSLFRNICETVAYRACTVLWGMVVRGLRVETFVRVLRSSRVNLNKCK